MPRLLIRPLVVLSLIGTLAAGEALPDGRWLICLGPPPAAPAASPTPPETKAVQPAAAASKPATVQSEPAAAASDLVHGQKIYVQACAYCQDRGIAGAPKTGDVAAWKVRTAQGMDSLYAVAVRGKGAMPAKGGNRSLSEADVKAAVDYMVAQSR